MAGYETRPHGPSSPSPAAPVPVAPGVAIARLDDNHSLVVAPNSPGSNGAAVIVDHTDPYAIAWGSWATYPDPTVFSGTVVVDPFVIPLTATQVLLLIVVGGLNVGGSQQGFLTLMLDCDLSTLVVTAGSGSWFQTDEVPNMPAEPWFDSNWIHVGGENYVDSVACRATSSTIAVFGHNLDEDITTGNRLTLNYAQVYTVNSDGSVTFAASDWLPHPAFATGDAALPSQQMERADWLTDGVIGAFRTGQGYGGSSSTVDLVATLVEWGGSITSSDGSSFGIVNAEGDGWSGASMVLIPGGSVVAGMSTAQIFVGDATLASFAGPYPAIHGTTLDAGDATHLVPSADGTVLYGRSGVSSWSPTHWDHPRSQSRTSKLSAAGGLSAVPAVVSGLPAASRRIWWIQRRTTPTQGVNLFMVDEVPFPATVTAFLTNWPPDTDWFGAIDTETGAHLPLLVTGGTVELTIELQFADAYWHPVAHVQVDWGDGAIVTYALPAGYTLDSTFHMTPNLVVTHNYAALSRSSPLVITADAIDTLGYVGISSAPGNPRLTANNLVVALPVQTIPPYQRSFPRDDDLGMGDARSWPPPTSSQRGVRSVPTAVF